MARARNIKPGFFKNEDLAECSPWARLCFAGLWTLADREGRLEDRAKRIKGELFAFDNVEVDPLLAELAKHRFITRYVAEGRGLIQINEFAKHQHPHHKEPESAFAPPQSPGLLLVASTPKPETLPPSDEAKVPDKPEIQKATPAIPSTPNPADSLSLESGALIPEEEACSVAPPTPPAAFDGENAKLIHVKALVPIAAKFELPEEWGLDAEALGFPRRSILFEAERFRQYWVTGKGSGKRKTLRGWRQAWSNWLGKAAERAA